MKKTKIVCTIGPATENEEMLEQLVQEGMNVCRLNFSHGTHEEHRKKIEMIKRVRNRLGIPLAIALDTKGPEIRLGTFAQGPVSIAQGDHLTLTTLPVEGSKERVSISYQGLPQDVHPGTRILVDDGLVEFVVDSVEQGTEIHCTAQNYGQISDRKGVNVPATDIQLPAITENDFSDILFGIEHGVDFIFASFIRKADDVLHIRRILEEHGGSDVHIYAKIESEQGVNNLDEILEASDGIMVARGDLGVEIPTERVPLVQKDIIRKSNIAGKPVITATQMLDSMTRNPRPTRAEVTDVANAILDGSDAIMLSGETAAGKYPAEAVRQMSVIAEVTEASVDFQKSIANRPSWQERATSSAIALSTCQIATAIEAKAIVTATASGFTSRQISRFRPSAPIIAATMTYGVARKLAMCWGVYPVIAEESQHTDELIERSIYAALRSGLAKEGDQIVLTAGIPVGKGQATNLIKVHTIGDILVTGTGIGKRSVVARACVGSTALELSPIFEEGDILVAQYADVDLTPFIEKASGVIVEEGGLTSHAAIVALHYNKPTIIGAERATELIHSGELITIDTVAGLVYAGEAQVL
ncbi:MAG: pyruvate kinase [Ndongobacter sp.]|nr:pyruvate kinase [Ndongobacter sp.]